MNMNMTTAAQRPKHTTSGRHILHSRQYTSSFSNIDWGFRSSERSSILSDDELGSYLDDSYEWRRMEDESPQRRQQQQQQHFNTTIRSTSDDDDSLLYVPLSTRAAAAAAAAAVEEKQRATSPAANEKHDDDEQPSLSQHNSAAYHQMMERHSSHLSEVSVDSDGFLHWDRSTKSCERWKKSGTKPSSSSS